jgi:hypothetical protein
MFDKENWFMMQTNVAEILSLFIAWPLRNPNLLEEEISTYKKEHTSFHQEQRQLLVLGIIVCTPVQV